MRKNFLSLISTLAFLLIISGCQNNNNSQINNSNKKLVLVSFTILEDIVSNIVGDQFVVKSITKPGMEVHGYQTTPSDLIKGSKASVFIENGFGFELWAEKFVSNLDVKKVTISDNLKPIFISEDAYKGKPNPHAWISPKRGKRYIDILVEELSNIEPSMSVRFNKNASLYKKKLSKIDEDFSLFLNTLEKKKKYLVSCEGAFSYLAYDYGLKEAYLWPVNAESQVTPKRMAKVINLVKENDIPAVFCESTVSSESQLTVARETGAIFGGNLFVDSLSGKDGPASSYLDLLNYNLNLFKKAFNKISKN
tara:strand:+ start:1142 stop:2065 length:924 start_codon:yes stop_codon:yes gene_type:complete